MSSKIFYLLFAILISQAINATGLVAMAHAGKWTVVEEILQCPTCKFNVNQRWREEFLCSVSIYHKRLCAQGHTALHHAAMAGNVFATRLLLENGANPHLTDYTGQTALHLAIAGGHQEIQQLLLDYGADPQQKPRSFSFAPSSAHIITAALLGITAVILYHYANRITYSSKTYQTSGSCVVCLEYFSNLLLRATQRLPCGHNNACPECLDTWLSISNTCPECRGPIK